MKFVAALLALVTATEATRSLSKARQLDQTQTAAYQQTAVNGDYVYGVYSDIYGNYQANGGYYDPSQNWAQNGGDENGNGWSQAYKDAFSSIYSYTQNAANGQAQAQQQGRENAQSMNYFFTISSEHVSKLLRVCSGAGMFGRESLRSHFCHISHFHPPPSTDGSLQAMRLHEAQG